ncbi:phage minor head protein [Methanobrevibacter sp.]|uniref:phage head morphogenesis protein n=1 Tax=Methanobrevibacter sp. TaxID=66852 RepID=UPI00386E83BA
MTNAVKIMLRKIAVKIKNETEIQLMRILFKTNGSKATKNKTSKRAYPHGIERNYARKLRSFFEPLTTYVEKYINENMEPLLRGDSNNVRLDAIPGDSFRDMIYNLEEWLAVYMPDISDVGEDSAGNVILASIAKTAEEAKKFGDKEFQKSIEKGIHVNPPVASAWWNDMLKSWAEDNYTLITSNAKKYITQINVLTEQAIVNGLSPKTLKEQIKKATESLSDKHCKLLARDQMGKLNGQISQAQSQELGLELYVWSTSMDDRVRESHQLMEGLLCRYDDATVCSYDNGKTWVDRPSGAVQLHPGQDIQCRCVGLAFYPELEAEMKNILLE